jgi:hypothetical protein
MLESRQMPTEFCLDQGDINKSPSFKQCQCLETEKFTVLNQVTIVAVD